jgi:dTDP-4-amino-4,6-dideoxygalactose transaminase
MEQWVALCDRQGIALLEDCAQSHLAQWNERAGGSFGRFGAYSFYPTKNLGALGDGGALVSDDGLRNCCRVTQLWPKRAITTRN